MDSDEGDPPTDSSPQTAIDKAPVPQSAVSPTPPSSVGLARQRSLQRSASAEMLRHAARADTRKGSGSDKPPPVSMSGPRPFSPLSRQISIKSKRGQGLTAHMTSLSIVHHSDSKASAASTTTSEGDVQTLDVPSTHTDLRLMSPTPMSPVSSPSPGSENEVDMSGTPALVHPRPHHHSPSLERVARPAPMRSRSADPSSPQCETPPTIAGMQSAFGRQADQSTDLAQFAISQPPVVSVLPVTATSHSAATMSAPLGQTRTKSPPPPPPPRRRKPPAPPVAASVAVTQGSRGETIHTIASSSPSPFSPPLRSSPLNPSTLASLRAKKPRNITGNGPSSTTSQPR